MNSLERIRDKVEKVRRSNNLPYTLTNYMEMYGIEKFYEKRRKYSALYDLSNHDVLSFLVEVIRDLKRIKALTGNPEVEYLIVLL